jgi:hypothetical protein
LLLLLFLLVADAEIADAWAPPHSTRLLLFSLSLLRPPGLRSFFGFLFVRLFLIAHQIDFDSLLIRSRILTHLFSFFSLLSKNKTKHKFRNFPCVCFGFIFIFLPGGVRYSFFLFNLFPSTFGVCGLFFLFSIFYFIFLCGVGFSLPFWLCPGLDGHQTMRRRRRMTAIWSLSTPPTRNGRLCLSSRHYRSVAKLSNVSCQSTKKKKKSNNTYVCVCV